MKIAWVTPFTRKSAIGRFSQAVTNELGKLHEVTVWHPHADEPLSSDCRTVVFHSAKDVNVEGLHVYDFVVYNMGNYSPYHLEIYSLSRLVPGLLILHDFVMHHFFASVFLELHHDEAGYLELMRRHYGARGEMRAFEALQGRRSPIWETDEVVSYPLFEEVAMKSAGVIVHSDFFLQRAIEACACPVERLHLAYPFEVAKEIEPRENLRLPTGKLIAASVGHVNPNRRILSVLQAIASDPLLRSRLHYVIAGTPAPAYAKQLKDFISDNGLSCCVELWGQVDDKRLHSLIAHSDFCINLRYPPTEGASASLVEQLRAGKAVVVSNSGCFSEVPEDCVMRVSIDDEQEGLVRALRALVQDARLRAEIGARGKEFAERHFTPYRYARDFEQAAWRIFRASPILSLADKVAAELGRIGVPAGDALIDRLAAEMEVLFCKESVARLITGTIREQGLSVAGGTTETIVS